MSTSTKKTIPINPKNTWKLIAIATMGVLAVATLIFIVVVASLARNTPSDGTTTGPAQVPPLSNDQQTCNSSACSSTADGASADVPPTIGKVTAISDSSITIDVNGKHYTFAITSDTKEYNAGGGPNAQPFNKDHSPVGEMVGVVPTKSGSTTAQLILSDFQSK